MPKFSFDAKTKQTLRKIFRSNEKSIENFENLVNNFIDSTARFDLIDKFIENFISSLTFSPNPSCSLILFPQVYQGQLCKIQFQERMKIFFLFLQSQVEDKFQLSLQQDQIKM